MKIEINCSKHRTYLKLTKSNPKKENIKKKEKGKEVKLDIDIGVFVGGMTIPVPLKEIAKLLEQQQQTKKSVGIQEEELPGELQSMHIPD